MQCREKILFHTAAIAEAARREYCAAHKKNKRNRRLVVYPCHHCGKFHLGHLRRKPLAVVAAPPVKQPTAGDLRRAEKRAAKAAARKAERAARYADWAETMRHVKFLVDREIERMKALGIYKEPAR
jgi:hypothetical protein